MQTITVTVQVPWDPTIEDGTAEEFLATVTDTTVVMDFSGYRLSGPGTFTVEETS